jgi:LmbE family N-acetylglucosaminyl deacetylase
MQLRQRVRSATAWVAGSGVELRGSIVVLSPHLDDGVFSLGAVVARAARRGADVTVLTVFAGDPASDLPAGTWDAAAGFASAGEAARLRRLEDEAACAVLGARAEWLPFADHQYPRDDDQLIVAAVRSAVEHADTVLLPGFPLLHEDHVRLDTLLRGSLTASRLGAYVEQPYAALWTAGADAAPVPWLRAAGGAAAQVAKARAMRAYRSQLPRFGARHPIYRILRYEAMRGGEAIAWLDRSSAAIR